MMWSRSNKEPLENTYTAKMFTWQSVTRCPVSCSLRGFVEVLWEHQQFLTGTALNICADIPTFIALPILGV